MSRPARQRTRAALHEIRCPECRESWAAWFRRLRGDDRPSCPVVAGPCPGNPAGVICSLPCGFRDNA